MGKIVLIKKTIIFNINIKNSLKCIDISDSDFKDCVRCSLFDADKIARFYKENEYDIFTSEQEIEEEFKRGSDFFGIIKNSRIVAGMWIHTGIVDINAPSFEALKDRRRHVVFFDDKSVYSSHNLVDPKYREQHLYSQLLKYVLFTKQKDADNYIYITGFDNEKMIVSGIKYNGQIIGIAFAIRLFKYIWIKKYYSFGPKYWKSIKR